MKSEYFTQLRRYLQRLIIPDGLARRLKLLLRYIHATFKDPLFIYQMGKVGSKSILHSLENCGLKPVTHFHLFELLDKPQERFVRRYLQNSKRQISIISPIREPVARNLSSFFHDFRGYFNGKDLNKLKLSELEKHFYTDYDRHNFPLEWFDKEFQTHTSIDVYEYSFPQKEGFLTIRQGRFRVLIFKLELPDEKKAQLIKDFLGLKEFQLQLYNTASEKYYKDVYKKFVDNIQVQDSYLERMYRAKFSEHFYSNQELKQFIEKWGRAAKRAVPMKS